MHNAKYEGEAIVWHREHRSKKGRTPKSKTQRFRTREFKKRKYALYLKSLE